MEVHVDQVRPVGHAPPGADLAHPVQHPRRAAVVPGERFVEAEARAARVEEELGRPYG
jgi:hypothetical protein